MKTQLFIILAIYSLISCDKNEIKISDSLKGQWKWKSSCGGIVGCTYASKTEVRTLIIDDLNFEITRNGVVEFKSSYHIKNTSTQDNAKVYEVEFTDGTSWTASISKNNLYTAYSAYMYSNYERTK
jgi:hypothetical protein